MEYMKEARNKGQTARIRGDNLMVDGRAFTINQYRTPDCSVDSDVVPKVTENIVPNLQESQRPKTRSALKKDSSNGYNHGLYQRTRKLFKDGVDCDWVLASRDGSKSFSIFHNNIRSLAKTMEELKIILDTLVTELDLIILTDPFNWKIIISSKYQDII
ncbi:hypothetical protein HHI36_008468 [Cryptolaemus montrouzieri]|uniref:Uncharacterized protein n=1 Tax=Cryptolaemus montrouzieri TaxID=559131 RepID=A0ABD2MSP2_9CUCU